MRINAVEPGYTATDLNNNTGLQTVQEGAEIIVRMAQTGPEGPTGGYFDALSRGAGVCPGGSAERGTHGGFCKAVPSLPGIAPSVEVPDGSHKRVRSDADALTSPRCLGEKGVADTDQPMDEVPEESIGTCAFVLQRFRQPVLGDQEIHEKTSPPLQCDTPGQRIGEQSRPRFGAGFDLVTVHGHEEICPCREMPVDIPPHPPPLLLRSPVSAHPYPKRRTPVRRRPAISARCGAHRHA